MGIRLDIDLYIYIYIHLLAYLFTCLDMFRYV